MARLIIYGLQIEIIAVGLFIYGFAMFLKAVRNISQEFKLAIILVLLSLILELLQGVMVMILLVNEITYESYLWLISPFIGLIGAYFLVLGSRKFLSESER